MMIFLLLIYSVIPSFLHFIDATNTEKYDEFYHMVFHNNSYHVDDEIKNFGSRYRKNPTYFGCNRRSIRNLFISSSVRRLHQEGKGKKHGTSKSWYSKSSKSCKSSKSSKSSKHSKHSKHCKSKKSYSYNSYSHSSYSHSSYSHSSYSHSSYSHKSSDSSKGDSCFIIVEETFSQTYFGSSEIDLLDSAQILLFKVMMESFTPEYGQFGGEPIVQTEEDIVYQSIDQYSLTDTTCETTKALEVVFTLKWISSLVSTVSYVYEFLDWINSPAGQYELNKFMNDIIGITLCGVGEAKIYSLAPQPPSRIPSPPTNTPTISSPIKEATSIPTKSTSFPSSKASMMPTNPSTNIPNETPIQSTSTPSSKATMMFSSQRPSLQSSSQNPSSVSSGSSLPSSSNSDSSGSSLPSSSHIPSSVSGGSNVPSSSDSSGTPNLTIMPTPGIIEQCNTIFNSTGLQAAVDEWIIDQAATEAKYGVIDCWNTSYVTSMESLFDTSRNPDVGEFNAQISSWDCSSVTTMNSMFNKCSFNNDVSNWNVVNVLNMDNMYSYAKFNEDISNWDVSSVNSTMSMFLGSSFNSDISTWDVYYNTEEYV